MTNLYPPMRSKPALRPEQAFPTERSGCVPGCTMRPGHTPPCCTCGPGSATCKRGCPDYRGATTERAFLGNPVRTSASVHLDAIRAAVREETADLRRDLGLAVEALAARHPLPTRDYGSVGWVVLRTEPDTGAVTTWTEEVYETPERAQEVVDDTHHYTRRLLSIGEVRRAS